jgi:chromatin assembly factor 1 subunit B
MQILDGPLKNHACLYLIDGNIILWRPTESKETVSRFAESDEDEFERETWRVQSMLRGSLSDIYDLAWSPDGKYIISGSIDNTARIWEIGTCMSWDLYLN